MGRSSYPIGCEDKLGYSLGSYPDWLGHLPTFAQKPTACQSKRRYFQHSGLLSIRLICMFEYMYPNRKLESKTKFTGEKSLVDLLSGLIWRIPWISRRSPLTLHGLVTKDNLSVLKTTFPTFCVQSWFKLLFPIKQQTRLAFTFVYKATGTGNHKQ